MNLDNRIMESITPHLINEAASDRQWIKEGWYAANTSGRLGNGPFLNREDCLADINQSGGTFTCVYRKPYLR
jgi:hypothetical protein